ncbi:MAG: MotA/TolQ/ExbB proton channel family protein [Oscillospiraceae bacterium]|nr:MotA/TolQ/ExbB proton channel family protein [Oscillospiraceae bacterium]
MSTVFHNVLRAVSGAMELPVVILLILLLAFAVFSVGWIIAEFFSEHRHMKEDLPALLEHLRDSETDLEAAIAESKLNRRQKATLQELTQHADFTRPLLDDLADNLLEQEQAHYDHMIKFTDLASKLGPMLGLLGTLIPLGPGIIALGQGDTYTLSVSLMTAFDTTVAGLCIAAVCMIVSTIRRRWYAAYMADLETLTSCVCERVKPQ